MTVAAALALAAAGCGDSGSGGTPAATTANGAPAASSDVAAAGLRSRLTVLLTDHVYLTAAAVRATLAAPADPTGAPAPEVQAATDALDANATAIARAITPGSPATTRKVLALWRGHDLNLVAYATGRRQADEAAVQGALGRLDDFRLQFTDVLGTAEPKLRKGRLSEDLKGHIETLAAALDAILDGDADAIDRLADAGAHMPATAALLAEGLVQGHPDRYAGDADAGGAVLRANLAGLLAADAQLTLEHARLVLASGSDGRAARRAAEAIDANATTLAETISSVYGEDAGQGITAAWRARAGHLADYAAAKGAKDAARATAALTALDRSHGDLALLFAGVDPKLRRAALTGAIARYDDAVTAAIRALAAESPKRFARAAEASAAGGAVAATVTRGITLQFPEKFTAES